MELNNYPPGKHHISPEKSILSRFSKLPVKGGICFLVTYRVVSCFFHYHLLDSTKQTIFTVDGPKGRELRTYKLPKDPKTGRELSQCKEQCSSQVQSAHLTKQVCFSKGVETTTLIIAVAMNLQIYFFLYDSTVFLSMACCQTVSVDVLRLLIYFKKC